MEPNLISTGCHVIVCRGPAQRIAKVSGKDDFFMEKIRMSLKTAVGQPFCTSFKVNRGKLTPTNEHDEDEMDAEDFCDASQSTDDRDNRNLLDTSTSQSLSKEDILELRGEGVSGRELIGKLVSNSATFQDKNVLTQQKYLRRKAKKHGDIVTLLRPTPRLLCEIHYQKNPEQMANLRLDSLAYVLSMANIHSGATVLLYEQTCGVLAASVLDRLGGRGALVQLFKGFNYQGFPAVEAMDFSPGELDCLRPVPLELLFDFEEVVKLKHKGGQRKAPVEECPKPEWSQERKDQFTAVEMQRKIRQTERVAKQTEGVELLKSGVDALIVALKSVSPVVVTVELLKYLKESRPFVVYSPFVEPLLDLFKQLMDNDKLINLQLTNSSLRRYQILPMRTHPEMKQLCPNGFVLSGIKLGQC